MLVQGAALPRVLPLIVFVVVHLDWYSAMSV